MKGNIAHGATRTMAWEQWLQSVILFKALVLAVWAAADLMAVLGLHGIKGVVGGGFVLVSITLVFRWIVGQQSRRPTPRSLRWTNNAFITCSITWVALHTLPLPHATAVMHGFALVALVGSVWVVNHLGAGVYANRRNRQKGGIEYARPAARADEARPHSPS